MRTIIFKAIPYNKELLTLALESGVDAILAEQEHAEDIKKLSRVQVLTPAQLPSIAINSKKDEEKAAKILEGNKPVLLTQGWEIIPVENLLAVSTELLALEVESLERAHVAAGVLEVGAKTVVVLPEATAQLKTIVQELKISGEKVQLQEAVITEIESAGLGHRVCVDTISMLKKGQGMLVGNSSAFTFLVHAETESNPYVAARPFRVNAGAVHAYAKMPGDRTSYLEELSAGSPVLIVGADGSTTQTTVGRSKVEIRPMLRIRAEVGEGADKASGQIFLQNAETIRLVRADGQPVSVVSLKKGDTILCQTDAAGRHFGMRITEEISEE